MLSFREKKLTDSPLFSTGCNVVVEKLPPMSPAKMFAYMKERESKAEHQEDRNVSSRTGNLFGELL